MDTISGVLFFVAFLPYVWAIVHHETVPSPVSWAIWASVDTLTALAMRKEKTLNGQMKGAMAGAWLITVLALWFGKPTMGNAEWVSIAGGVLGIILWQTTGNAVTAIVSCQAALLVGAVPTFVNGYNNPAQEDAFAWTIWTASCVCALLAVKKWDLANALQPITFTIIEVVMFALVVIRPNFM